MYTQHKCDPFSSRPTQFGVEIRLSQFTLTKLVIVTPYYLLVNETKVLYMYLFFHHVHELIISLMFSIYRTLLIIHV